MPDAAQPTDGLPPDLYDDQSAGPAVSHAGEADTFDAGRQSADQVRPTADGATNPYSVVRPGADALRQAEDSHFWFVVRNLYILDLLHRHGIRAGDRFLELGCGSGTVLSFLRASDIRADGLDINPHLCREARARCTKAEVFQHDINDPAITDVTGIYPAAGMFDVLEHMDAPAIFLKTAARVVEPGGLIVGTVPALTRLWSPLDDASGHYVRYHRSTVRHDILAAGLEPVELRYFYQSLVVPMWWQRRAMRRLAHEDAASIVREGMRVPAPTANAVALAVCRIERRLSHVLPLGYLPGASLLFACRRCTH